MVGVHSTVGTLVLLAFLSLVVVNVLQLVRHRDFAWTIMLSRTAALLLLVQYVLGFNLLSGGHRITPFHYLLALASLVTVGLEHGKAYPEPDAERRHRLATATTAGTLVLVLAAWSIGMSR